MGLIIFVAGVATGAAFSKQWISLFGSIQIVVKEWKTKKRKL